MTDAPQNADGKYPVGQHPDLPPPPGTVGWVGWLRKNLVSTPLDAILSFLLASLAILVIPAAFNWAVTNSVTEGSDRTACVGYRALSTIGRTASTLDLQALSIDTSAMTLEVPEQAALIGQQKLAQTQAKSVARQLAAFNAGYAGDIAKYNPEFVALMAAVDPASIVSGLNEAIAANDAIAIESLFASLAPLVAYGDSHSGACWTLVKIRFNQFMYGFYDDEEYWRVNLAGILMMVAVVWVLFEKVPFRKTGMLFACAFPIIAFFLLIGGLGMVPVETTKWGGLMLTCVVGVTGIVASLPIGVVLALGRRSEMTVIRVLCVGFIEFVRGVPLITILFMGSTMLPFFAPEGTEFNKLARALIVVALFSSAYMAETVRGGLQAIPKGQYEGAQALGLGYWRMMWLIVLPQALKIVIPGIVNSFIGLFKDTTLVLIIGLFDLLGIAKAAVTNGSWIGLSNEAYAFVGFTFFIFCFSMARYSIWLEGKLHTGHKR